jgi:hypothetical protein
MPSQTCCESDTFLLGLSLPFIKRKARFKTPQFKETVCAEYTQPPLSSAPRSEGLWHGANHLAEEGRF